ncbi:MULTISPECIES: TetR family transcriptional regulator [unclassified Lysinibacillus]|uniref:TetR family transcriptional regulator n=1 Tax=unclassified Lysinibacillus TaxID=2636778 RepID=UPI0030F77288
MDKEKRIVTSAIQLFKEQGIDKIKIADIVKRAGIAQGTFYLYFPSKMSLMPAIAKVMVDNMFEAIQKNVDDQAPLIEKFNQLVDTIFMMTREHKELVAIIYAGLSASDYLKDWVNAYTPYYNWLRNELDSAKSKGEILIAVDSYATSKMVFGLIESAAERAYLFDSKDEELINEDKKDLLEFIFNALVLNKAVTK